MRLWRPRADVFCTEATGYMEFEHAVAYCDFGDEVWPAAPGLALGFHDWAGLTGYATDTRKMVTQWGMSVILRYDAVHILHRSKLLSMGLALASAVLPKDLRIHTERGEFDRLLHDTLAVQATG